MISDFKIYVRVIQWIAKMCDPKERLQSATILIKIVFANVTLGNKQIQMVNNICKIVREKKLDCLAN